MMIQQNRMDVGAESATGVSWWGGWRPATVDDLVRSQICFHFQNLTLARVKLR